MSKQTIVIQFHRIATYAMLQVPEKGDPHLVVPHDQMGFDFCARGIIPPVNDGDKWDLQRSPIASRMHL